LLNKGGLVCALSISVFMATKCVEISGQSPDGTSVDVTAREIPYGKEPVDSIRKVDFKNFRYSVVEGETHSSFRLRDGKFKRRFDVGGEEISLDHVFYFRGNSAGPEWALVQLDWISAVGSSTGEGVLQVFKFEDKVLFMTQQLTYDLHARGTGMDFNPKSGTLTVRARTNDDSPHCCPRSLDIVTYRWDGKSFKQKSHKRIPAEEG